MIHINGDSALEDWRELPRVTGNIEGEPLSPALLSRGLWWMKTSACSCPFATFSQVEDSLWRTDWVTWTNGIELPKHRWAFGCVDVPRVSYALGNWELLPSGGKDGMVMATVPFLPVTTGSVAPITLNSWRRNKLPGFTWLDSAKKAENLDLKCALSYSYDSGNSIKWQAYLWVLYLCCSTNETVWRKKRGIEEVRDREKGWEKRGEGALSLKADMDTDQLRKLVSPSSFISVPKARILNMTSK